jgi:hypothetical protein
MKKFSSLLRLGDGAAEGVILAAALTANDSELTEFDRAVLARFQKAGGGLTLAQCEHAEIVHREQVPTTTV